MKILKYILISLIIQLTFVIIAVGLGYFFPSWDTALLWFFGYMAGMIVTIIYGFIDKKQIEYEKDNVQ